MHHFHRRFSASLSFFIVLAASASSAPTTPQSAFSHLPNAATHDLSIVQQTPNNSSTAGPDIAPGVNTTDHSILKFGPSSQSNLSSPTGGITRWAGVWDISPTLSLGIDIGEWRLSPEKVIDTLGAAEIAVGKKPAAGVLEGMFTQRTGSRLNTMVFEIGPEPEDERRLNWGDVAEVLGEERGLPRFFRETGEWRNIDFEVVHTERGVLGFGMVRKWYMVSKGRNGTGLETG